MILIMKEQNGIAEISIGKFNIKQAIKSAMTAIAAAILMLLIISSFVYLSVISEAAVKPITYALSIILVFISGFITSSKSKYMGWANGLITGAAFLITMYILRIIMSGNFALTGSFLTFIVIVMILSAIGGIFGINYRAKKKSKIRR